MPSRRAVDEIGLGPIYHSFSSDYGNPIINRTLSCVTGRTVCLSVHPSVRPFVRPSDPALVWTQGPTGSANENSTNRYYTSDWSLSQDVRKLVFGRFPGTNICYTINGAHKQYSLLVTIFNYICYFGPPGKHLFLSPPKPLHVDRRGRPTCSRLS